MKLPVTKLLICLVCAVGVLSALAFAQQQNQGTGAPRSPLYNTAKQKLLDGKQVFSFTQSTFDVDGYCEKAAPACGQAAIIFSTSLNSSGNDDAQRALDAISMGRLQGATRI
jgi:hypothetical protein